jgi:hypothetical protein
MELGIGKGNIGNAFVPLLSWIIRYSPGRVAKLGYWDWAVLTTVQRLRPFFFLFFIIIISYIDSDIL